MHQWPRRFILTAMLAGILGRRAVAVAADLRLQLNPALARINARSPETVASILTELDRILRGPPVPGSWQTRRIDDPTYRALLDENPLLQEAYRLDPRAVLLQLKEIASLDGGR